MTSRPAVKGKDNEVAPLLETKETMSTSSSRSSFSSSSSNSPVAAGNGNMKSYPPVSDFPNGKSIGLIIWNGDPTSNAMKALYIGLTVAGLTCMFFTGIILLILKNFFTFDTSWDAQHGIVGGMSIGAFPELMAITLGIPLNWVYSILSITLASFFLLVVADVILGKTMDQKVNLRTHPWPASWKTDNTQCYHEMFSEPTRFGRLIRRPGNTLSNATYFVACGCVFSSSLFSSSTNIFWIADFEFGIMLFLLGVTSCLWHGTNAPWTQYPDLWSMDSCIAYLIVRFGCLGGLLLLPKLVSISPQQAKQVAGLACALIYSGIIVALGKFQWNWFQKGYLHGGCPFSGRARLVGKADVWGQGQQDVHVVHVCAFAGLPVYYTALPTIIQTTLVGSVGSVITANWLFRTLVIGWTYRIWERFVIDGCAPMNYFTPAYTKQPSLLQTIGTAIFSPTAVLHFFTGWTLLAGYMHARTVEGTLY